MTSVEFALDERLAADTAPVISLSLCDVLLMNDARFRWLILVPRRGGVVEITDLCAADQASLWSEVNDASAALRGMGPCEKLNLGALGNIVRQLHIHLVARTTGDAAWPGPVWGNGTPVAYAPAALAPLLLGLRRTLER